jgi:hypothetical protein
MYSSVSWENIRLTQVDIFLGFDALHVKTVKYHYLVGNHFVHITYCFPITELISVLKQLLKNHRIEEYAFINILLDKYF